MLVLFKSDFGARKQKQKENNEKTQTFLKQRKIGFLYFAKMYVFASILFSMAMYYYGFSWIFIILQLFFVLPLLHYVSYRLYKPHG